jgi:hypothetical protein
LKKLDRARREVQILQRGTVRMDERTGSAGLVEFGHFISGHALKWRLT